MGGLKTISESQEELKKIDTGMLIITTHRIVFSGTKRTTNIKLKNVIAIQPYSNGVAVQRENKQRTEHFVNTDKLNLKITHEGRSYVVPVDGTLLNALILGLIKKL